MQVSNAKYPKDSNNQKIGRKALAKLQDIAPDNWIITSLGGDDDFGLDCQVQNTDGEGNVHATFYIQLKGTENKKNILENTVKFPFKTATLNYLNSLETMSLLVICDLTDQTEAKCYYVFTHEKINEMMEGYQHLDTAQNEFTIKIPKENQITKQLDFTSILYQRSQESHIKNLKFLYKKKEFLEDSHNVSLEDFPTRKKIINDSYYYSRGKISLDAFLPKNYHFNISCMFYFRLPYMNNVFITPSHNEMIENIFSGYKSSPSSHSRSWIRHVKNDIFTVQFSNITFDVPADVIIDLCEIFDDLFTEFTNRLLSFEKKLSSFGFPRSVKYKRGFKLIKIDRILWQHMLQFSKSHLKEDGESEWHIFLYDNYSIRIYKKDLNFAWYGNIVISPEPDTQYNYLYPDNKICLVWDPLVNETEIPLDFENTYFTPMDVLKFLLDQLIPKVLYELEAKSFQNQKSGILMKFLKKQKNLTYDQFILDFDIIRYINFDYSDNSKYLVQQSINEDNLIILVNKLQSFFHSNRKKIYINFCIMQNLYQGIIFLLEKFNNLDISSLSSNLHSWNNEEKSKNYLIADLKSRVEEMEQGTYNSFHLDLVLRCYQVLIEDNIHEFNQEIYSSLDIFLNELLLLKNRYYIAQRWLD